MLVRQCSRCHINILFAKEDICPAIVSGKHFWIIIEEEEK